MPFIPFTPERQTGFKPFDSAAAGLSATPTQQATTQERTGRTQEQIAQETMQQQGISRADAERQAAQSVRQVAAQDEPGFLQRVGERGEMAGQAMIRAAKEGSDVFGRSTGLGDFAARQAERFVLTPQQRERVQNMRDKDEKKRQEGKTEAEILREKYGTSGIIPEPVARTWNTLGGLAGVALSPVAGLFGAFTPEIESGTEGAKNAALNAAKNVIVRSAVSQGVPDDQADAIADIVLRESGEQAAEQLAAFKQNVVDPTADVLTDTLFGGDRQQAEDSVYSLMNLSEFAAGGLVAKPVAEGAEQLTRMTVEGIQAAAQKGKSIVEDIRANRVENTRQSAQQIRDEIDRLRQSDAVREADELEKLATQNNIELPASSFGGAVTQKVEGIAAGGFFGEKVAERAQNAIDRFDEIATDIENQARTSTQIGQDIATSFRRTESQLRNQKNELYDNAGSIFESSTKPAPLIDDLQSMQFIDEQIEQLSRSEIAGSPTAKKELAIWNQIKDGINRIKNDDDAVINARALLRDIGNRANFDAPIRTGEEKIWGSLYNRLSGDIDSSISKYIPELKPAIDKAKKFNADVQKLMKKDFAKKIKSLADKGQFDKIAEAMSRAALSVQEIKTLYKTVGAATISEIQKGIMRDIIRGARSRTLEGFEPAGFSKIFKSFGDEKLNAMLAPSQVKQLRDLDTLNKAIARSQAIARGSQTATIIDVMSTLASVPAALISGGSALIVPVAKVLFNRFLSGNSGQEWLKNLSVPNRKKIKKLEEKLNKMKLPEESKKFEAELNDKNFFDQGFGERRTPQMSGARGQTGIERATSAAESPGFRQAGSATSASITDDELFSLARQKLIQDKMNNGESVIVDVDSIKQLHPAFDPKKPELIHDQTSKVADDIYREALSLDQSGKVKLTGGGAGSGKSEVIMKNIQGEPSVILDGTLKNFAKSKKRIQDAIDAGKEVEISVVYTPIEDAKRFNAARPRSVSNETLEKTHRGFRETIPKLVDEFPEVGFRVFENSMKTGRGGLRKEFSGKEEMIEYINDRSSDLYD